MVGLLVACFYGVSTLFGSFNAELNFKHFNLVRETRVQSQVVSYQRLLKWYLIPPCLTLSNIRYVSKVKWNNPEKGIAPSPTLRCSSYWKGSLLVTLDYVRQLYFTSLNVKTVLFQAIRFSISTLFISIWLINKTLSGATTSRQSEPGSDGNKGELCIPQTSGITGASPSDCLLSYPEHSWCGELLPLCREAVGLFYSPSRVGKYKRLYK